MASKGLSLGMLTLFRLGVITGISVLIYMHTTYMSKESFRDWETSYNKLQNSIANGIDARFDSIQNQLNRIESKVDTRLPPRRAENQVPGTVKQLAIITNLYENSH